MQPVAQRNRARDRTRRKALGDNRRLLGRASLAPARCPGQHPQPTETVPINWQISWQTIPLPRLHEVSPSASEDGNRETLPVIVWGIAIDCKTPHCAGLFML
jgi:hypothetical protein